MKKLLLTLLVSIALGGFAFAQEGFDWYWPKPANGTSGQCGLCAAIAIDGHVFTVEDEGWDQLEFAAFTGDVIRARDILTRKYVDQYGDPYPITDFTAVQYDDPGVVVSFKLYDHINEVVYDICEVTYLDEPMTIVTGVEHTEAMEYEPYLPVILNFTKSYTKDITAYTPDTKDHYYLIASPIGTVSPEDVTNMLSNSYDLYYFDQEGPDGKEWITYKEGEGATDYGFDLDPGKGYLYANSGNGTDPTVTLTFAGAPYNEDTYTVNLVKSANAELSFQGWNLVGNPFGQNATISKSSFYVMNEGGTEIESATRNYVEAMEGIFVVAGTDEEPLTFTKATNTKGNEQLVINMTQNRGSVVDRAIVRFNQENGLPKFQLNPNHTKVYIPQNGKDYAVVHSDSKGELPVNFKASKNGTYTFSVTAEEVDVNYLHLIDNLTGADVDLMATPSYSFEAKTTDYDSRFKLVFATGYKADDTFAYFSNGSWFINNDGQAILQVIDVNGHILSSETISGSASKYINAAPGVYVMRLINGDNVKTQKIVVSK